MRQEQFEQLHGHVWQRFGSLLEQLEGSGKPVQDEDSRTFPQLYRRLCHLFALAQERQYSPYLVEHLNDLVLRGHNQLYGHTRRRNPGRALIQFLLADFPRLVREQWRFVWLAAVLLFGPGILLFLAVQWQPELALSVLPADQLGQFEDMYRPGQARLGRDREADTDFMMFGYYIQNNISIAFRCFAGGLLFMAGTVMALVYNGLMMGTVAGHLTRLGFDQPFFSFVVGHCAFELTAIVLAGAAGLRLGYALLAPGRLTRLESLRQAGAVCVRIMYGVILMLLVAAFIEAFWSSIGTLPVSVKYGVGALLWGLVLGYFRRAGRVHAVG